MTTIVSPATTARGIVTDGTVSDQFDADEHAAEEKIINEEYKTWKKNAIYLYDLLLTSALDWPTLTVQWFPDKQECVFAD